MMREVRRGSTWLALILGLIAVALGVGALVLVVLNGLSGRRLLTEFPIGAEIAITFPVVGAVIAARRPANAIGWLFCAIGLSQGLVELSYQYAQYAFFTRPGSLPLASVMAWLQTWAWMPGFGLLLTFLLLLFPTGRLPSPRWRPLAWVSAACLGAMIAISAAVTWPLRGADLMRDSSELDAAAGPLVFAVDLLVPVLLVCGLVSGASLVVRFRRSTGVERQQLKWFTFAACSVVAFVAPVESGLFPSGFEALISGLGLLLIIWLPLATALAVLKYRLYDIDRIINRTLVYGTLTALLALAYFGIVVVVQGVLGERVADSPLAVAAITLVVAALFRPARARIQSVIDRRFNRRKYDAQQTADAFSARLRDEVDLDTLVADLLGVVHKTMEPAHASVWVRQEP